MLNRETDPRFIKDLKRYGKKHYDFSKMHAIIDELANDNFIMGKAHNNHALVGNWTGYWELHIEPDVLLIYKRDKENLYLFRLGSHDELFE
ncbi:MAG: type II toxin-antitoxin system YafQ family toxin [Rickettsiales bacterium]|nr:type II toxin-antitoxin system YafQ family toxin [Rickettsiales bacterium]